MRNFIAILSLVNLCFLSVWQELIFVEKADSYWIPSFQTESYMAVIFNVLGVASVVWCFLRITQKWGNNFFKFSWRLGFLLALIFPLNYLRKIIGINSNTVYWLTSHEMFFPMAVLALAVIGVITVYALTSEHIVGVVTIILLIFAPFSLVTLGQASWKALERVGDDKLILDVTGGGGFNEPVSKGQRVIWIIFDELDLRLAFTGRPDNLNLPEFDRFRNQSIFASHALSHSKNTEEAIPSYLTGRLVSTATPISRKELRLKYENSEEGQYHFLTEESNFFSEAYDLGARTAIVGLYHPYCRLFSRKVSFCSWYALNTYTAQASTFLLKELSSQISGISPLAGRINGILTYKEMLKTASNVATSSEYDVIYIHASVPHGPDIFNRDSDKFTLVNTSKAGYFGNLILADKFLGSLRRSMEAAKLWDETVILITSDHEWRHVYLYDNIRVKKIPFFIKMANQHEAILYDEIVSPMLFTKDLLLEVFSSGLKDADGVVRWLNNKQRETVENNFKWHSHFDRRREALS